MTVYPAERYQEQARVLAEKRREPLPVMLSARMQWLDECARFWLFQPVTLVWHGNPQTGEYTAFEVWERQEGGKKLATVSIG